jgi:hypothetical protein
LKTKNMHFGHKIIIGLGETKCTVIKQCFPETFETQFSKHFSHLPIFQNPRVCGGGEEFTFHFKYIPLPVASIGGNQFQIRYKYGWREF